MRSFRVLLTPLTRYEFDIDTNNTLGTDELIPMGAFDFAWASGGWYIYTDPAWSNGNLFIGDQGDNYSNIFDGVGDAGVDGNDRWNYRFNINFG